MPTRSFGPAKFPVFSEESIARRIAQQNAVPGAPGVGMQQQPAITEAFDPIYAEGQRQVGERLAGINSYEELARRRMGEDYTRNLGDLQRGQTQALESWQNRLGDTGLVFSGINIGEQGRIGNEFTRRQNDLATEQARSAEDLMREVTGQRQQVESEKQKLELDKTQRAIQKQMEDALAESQAQANQWYAQWLQAQNQLMLQQVQPQVTPNGQIVPGR